MTTIFIPGDVQVSPDESEQVLRNLGASIVENAEGLTISHPRVSSHPTQEWNGAWKGSWRSTTCVQIDHHKWIVRSSGLLGYAGTESTY